MPSFKTLCGFGSILSLVFGLMFLVAPQPSGQLYGAGPGDAWLHLMFRYFGACFVMYAAAVWGLRGLADEVLQRQTAKALCVATLAGLAVTLHGVFSGSLNAWGWSSVAIYVFFSVGWARCAWGR